MKKKLIYLQVAALIFIIFFSLIFVPYKDEKSSESLNDCREYLENWQVMDKSGSRYYDELPDFIETDNEKDMWFTRTLSGVKDGDCMGFFSFQQQVTVSIDGVQVYSFVPSENIKSSTPGNRWNFIKLNEDDNGKELSVHIYQCYSDERISVPRFYYGTQAGIVLKYTKTEKVYLAISYIMILIGCMLGLFSILYRKKTKFDKGIIWFSLFAIFRGLWTAIEANTYSFLFTKILLFSWVSYLCLKLAVVTFLQFINITFHKENSRVLSVLIILAMADFWLSLLCQMCFGIDFANTIYITHIILITAGIYTFICSMRELRNYEQNNTRSHGSGRKNIYIAQVACTVAIIVGSVIDLVRYYAVNSPDVARYSRFGDFIYIVTMSVTMFIDFIGLMKMGRSAEKIKEEAAHDPLTGIMNRAAFEHDIMQGNRKQWKKTSIVMLDLNNLKYFNDVYGHEKGDQYIVMSSKIIKEAYTGWGNVYRIGGDEFCIIAKDLSLEKFMEIRSAVENQIESIGEMSKYFSMDISAGYAAFEDGIDNDLRDTMKRADAYMYKRKSQLKKRN